MPKQPKHVRVLAIYCKLLNNERVSIKETAQYYNVDEKSIRRDISDIRSFLEENSASGELREVIYDRAHDTYKLSATDKLSREEIFALGKILLESRPLNNDEFDKLFEKMIHCCAEPADLQMIRKMLRNERFHYIEPRHRKKLIHTIWELSCAVQDCRLVEMSYERLTEPRRQSRTIKPVGIMFSDFYFYLAGYIADRNTVNPTLYRIDRIKSYKILDEHFKTPYSSKFEEGEFRKRVQFMYGGDLLRVELKYSGESVEAIMDRLPTAQVLKKGDGYYIIRAEVFGRGIKPWILSQADKIEVLNPKELRDEIRELIEKIKNKYN